MCACGDIDGCVCMCVCGRAHVCVRISFTIIKKSTQVDHIHVPGVGWGIRFKTDLRGA